MKLPKWGKWLATDKNGEQCAYENKPIILNDVWVSYVGRYKLIAKFATDPNWKNSLRHVGDTPATAGNEVAEIDPQPNNKYQREIKPGVFVDVYDVLAAWKVQNPALQHLIKKALQPGERGHKTLEQDMADIVASAVRAQDLEIERGN